MSTIDKQRIAAVRKLEQLGFTFAADDWMHPANDATAITPTITDELHALLMKRADDLEQPPREQRRNRSGLRRPIRRRFLLDFAEPRAGRACCW